MTYFCSQQLRRGKVLQHTTLTGIDYLEVCDSGPDCGCGKQLFLTLLKPALDVSLTLSQINITGGTADAQVHPVEILAATPASPRTITINLDSAGDFSQYTLSLIANPATTDPPDGFDPQLSTVTFSFKAGCDAPGDCEPDTCCPPPHVLEPDINYLAKEFDGFTQVMLDRLAVLVPDWRESHPPDVGVALVEALAYVADRLSYQQDSVGTEAYLGTARSRISLRRHARLVDYRLDEGANARTWIYVNVLTDGIVIPAGTRVYPRVAGLPVAVHTDNQLKLVPAALTFETLASAMLYRELDELQFYTWSDLDCCLPAGSTEATLASQPKTLKAGMVLVFEEVLGPKTGSPDDADPAKRWAVRLTNVVQTDYKSLPLTDPLNGQLITRIYWDKADALPFPLCISSPATTDPVSVAHGNIIPADHGMSLDAWEDLGIVPDAPPSAAASASCSCGSSDPVTAMLPRYFPRLKQAPITVAVPLDITPSPAGAFLDPAAAPAPVLQVKDNFSVQWTVLSDLLKSTAKDPVVVPEIESDGAMFLRFGDNEHGQAVSHEMSFYAKYRVGNGAIGNLAQDSIAHIVTTATGIKEVRNPLAGTGGRDPETMEHIRQRAPFAFRTQLRAVTEDDYGVAAQRYPAIREARGTLRWTGSWYTASVSVDAVDGSTPSATLAASTLTRLDLMRMAGVDLEVEPAILAGLRIEMNICVDREHFQSDVRDAVLRVFITGNQCNGQPGILNPANFAFGQTIYTSPLIAAAQRVEGVATATLTAFQRMDDPTFDGAAQGFLSMHRTEIARCDNDPNRLDRGVFVLHMDGGK